MHGDNIAHLREEALRLIKLELASLERMKSVPGLLSDGEASQTQTLDMKSADEAIGVLRGELHKLENLDMVLAVVGTMKAGKSTTINAIVGTEVLPNRNGPMTAIPTLIRHTPGQLEPVLRMTHLGPMQKLISDLRARMGDPNVQKELAAIESSDDDLRQLVCLIQKGWALSEVSEGTNDIFSTLKGLNDLVRLASRIKTEFPFHEYTDVEKLPVISVAFAHLGGLTDGTGTFTLLDTPGPNEDGQEDRLRPMLKEQLRKASAVLAVMDYTQLKSEADSDVLKDIQEIASIAKGRLYAVVNKFDQKDRHGMDADTVKTVVRGRMNSIEDVEISTDHIFPVSARSAYLSHCARLCVKQHGNIPDPEKMDWVGDFARLAFGDEWDLDDLEDEKKVLKKAEGIWGKSLFVNLLDRVKLIHAASMEMAFGSALSKLNQYALSIDNLCGTREVALSKDTESLQYLMQDLLVDVQRIDKCEEVVKTSSVKQIEEFFKVLFAYVENLRNETEGALRYYFQHGDLKEVHEEKKRKAGEKRTSFFDVVIEPPEFDATEKIIKFGTDRQQAQLLLRNIKSSVEIVLNRANKKLKIFLEKEMSDFGKEFQNDLEYKVRPVLDQLLDKLQKQGFGAIKIYFPEWGANSLGLSGNWELGYAVEADYVSRSRRVEQDGVLASVKRTVDVFGYAWGYDIEGYKKLEYNVNMEKIKNGIMAELNYSFKDLQSEVVLNVTSPLESSFANFFAMFRQQVEDIRGDLHHGLNDKSLRVEEQKQILQALRELKIVLFDLQTDAKELVADLKSLLPVLTKVPA